MISSNLSAFSDIAPQSVVSAPQGSNFFIDPIDVIERLPAEAQGALADLRERVDSIQSVIADVSIKKQDAWKARGEAETNYLVLTDAWAAQRAGRSGTVPADHPLAIAAKVQFDKASRLAREADGRYDVTGMRFQTHKRLLTDVESYIAAARNLTMAPALKLKFPSSDRLAAEVEKIREDIAELRAERHAITSAAYPSIEAKARVRAEIEMLAERGKPRVTQLIDHGPMAGVGWPDLVAKASIHGMATWIPGDEARTSQDLPGAHLALTAWLHKDALLAALEVEIDAVAEDSAALSTETRAAKLAEVNARILDAERIECALIGTAGGSVDFRSDTDPRAALGVVGPAPREN